MGIFGRLLPPVIAAAIVGLFITFSIFSVESARQDGLARQATASTPIPSVPARPTVRSSLSAGASQATVPAAVTPAHDIESVRKGCMEEMKATSVVALGTDSDCDRYAKLLDRQFANVQPSPTYNSYQANPAQSRSAPARQQRSSVAAAANEPMTDAELERICGKRFDDFNGRNLEELERRYRIRRDSLVPADSEEMKELRCRIQYASVSP